MRTFAGLRSAASQQVSKSAGRRVSESASQQVSESVGQRVSESVGQRVGKSASQQVGESESQQVSWAVRNAPDSTYFYCGLLFELDCNSREKIVRME